jgi:hypothetical protein
MRKKIFSVFLTMLVSMIGIDAWAQENDRRSESSLMSISRTTLARGLW